jgi:hypothetical protein
MSEPDRDTVLRTIEDIERTVAEFRSNNVVLSTTVLLRRLPSHADPMPGPQEAAKRR